MDVAVLRGPAVRRPGFVGRRRRPGFRIHKARSPDDRRALSTVMGTTSCLHVPEIGLVVAGDAVYNDVHLHLSESDHEGRLDWLAALRTIESLHPTAVVAGHKRATRDDDPRIVGETRQYIRDFNRIVETATTARELYCEVLK